MWLSRLTKVIHGKIFRAFHARSTQTKKVNLILSTQTPIHTVSAEYLSFSIDISVLVGGYWWEGSQGVKKGLGTLRVPPIDLDNKKLDRLVQALGPSYIRIGGSEADKIHYLHAPEDEPDALVLTAPMWDKLHAFIQRNNLKLVFTFKYGLFERSQHGAWQGSEIQKLLDYSKQKGYQVDICELGNELNAYWAFHGIRSQPGGKNLALDYATFAQLIKDYYPEIKVMGPGSAYWPKLGESLTPLPNLTQKFLQNLNFKLDIVSWHYYPFQSTRSPVRTRTANLRALLSPRSYNDFKKYSEKLSHWRHQYQPQAEFWTGETGSAQCGGQPQLSDRFASCFWWAEQLGCGAALGQKVMIRQSLVGGDYGLINRLTLKPRPDFWVSWLWVQLMGQNVYAALSNHPRVRVYCHQHPTQHYKTLMLINISHYTVNMLLPQNYDIQQRYVLTAKKIDAKKLLINGIKPKLKKGKISLTDFPKLENTADLPPYSISFWLLEMKSEPSQTH
ncbi:glycoside hydrolase [Catenovulum sediminis]|uniref:glycoside hydrolase n=1 Tax=Catenovulum sediminis TaxID=1740262 RepID=UPI00117F1E94|nr:glycoside hydrolase [Catenovulum sediminis]